MDALVAWCLGIVRGPMNGRLLTVAARVFRASILPFFIVPLAVIIEALGSIAIVLLWITISVVVFLGVAILALI